MILTGVVVGVIVAAYLAASSVLMFRLGLSLRQALLYLPLKLLYRIDDRRIRLARDAEAPVIYVVTHQSRLDPALMLSLLPDDTLHILDEESAKAMWLEPWRELARTIAFNAEHLFVSRRLVRVLNRKGRIAVYLPENVEPDTRDFRLYRAVSRIALQGDARIVPVIIDGARHLPFSLIDDDNAPRRVLPKLRIGTLEPLTINEMTARAGAATTTGSNALFDRMAEARGMTAFSRRSLFQAVRSAARRFGADRQIVEDAVSGTLTYRQLLMAARIFAGRFARMTAPGEAVGVLLPNSNSIAISLLGLMSAGRTAAMINYTAGPANVTSAVRTALIRTIVSSRAFIEKAGLEDIVEAAKAGGARLVWAEDIRDGITGFDRLAAALCWQSPVGSQDSAAPALIMFTSGSEGAPKAVVLSHQNLISNAMQVEARLAIGPRDFLMNVLPVFHSFGLLGGLILPLLTGVRTLLYPSPLHYKQIPKVAAKRRPTILFSTDTFLSAYAKAADDDDFVSLRFAVAGAEPLRAETRRIWKEHFGTRLLEGFGLTEAAPVVAVSTATHNREGSVGRLLPGVRVRLEPVEGITDGGRLWIRGPNVMMGYMSADRPGVLQQLPESWHDTGDIVSFDREGFVTIRGRAKRFAKIAGEMVSLGAVEMLVQSLWPEHRHAVVAVPDKRRGERIVLVTTATEADAVELRRAGKEAGLAELAVPQDIVKVDEIPILGTGKIDYPSTRRLAIERLGLPAAA
ncbi:AMP-binding protein [Mesorhizobium sp. IMUNJ 23232]|uniref:AMP-binding protein n=1 Tax=Mesorhizobium sp. IMUNJ 23232 TaxID=3376064 RepID=UPI0037B63ED2